MPTPAATTPSPSGTPSPTPSPGASEPPSAAPACTSPGTCGFPDASSTGPRISLERHDTGNMSIKKDGTVIKGWDIRGSLDVYANDVTVIDSRITSANWWGINLRPGFSGLKVLHTTITAVPGKGPDNGGVNYAVSNMGGSSIEVGWCDISVFGNALSMGQGDLHDNYVHDLVAFRNQGGEWQHIDAVISGGGNNGRLTIRRNTLLNSTPVDKGATAAVGLFADTGVVSSVVVDGNWLAGERTRSTAAARAPPVSRSRTTSSPPSTTRPPEPTVRSPPGTRAAPGTCGRATGCPTAGPSSPNPAAETESS
ncbi:hypothetical protein WKI68_10320 [Streptomyces sp. MS1.HAVA.3]|uniref:Lipoprotein n=1 Tax=Streptomyces caledonius TaxID=3134107 RepID=A0ABU8U1K8_9ACTN